MKKMSKIISILTIVFMVMVIFSNILMAVDPSTIKIDTTGNEKITTVGGKIVGGIQVIGSVVAVGILVVLGIKYMLGSAEEKAEYKKTMIPYIIGAVLIFAASYLAGAVYNFANGLNTTTTTK